MLMSGALPQLLPTPSRVRNKNVTFNPALFAAYFNLIIGTV